MTVEIISCQFPQKYGAGLESNLRPLDLQSDLHLLPDTLLTALHGPVSHHSTPVNGRVISPFRVRELSK